MQKVVWAQSCYFFPAVRFLGSQRVKFDSMVTERPIHTGGIVLICVTIGTCNCIYTYMYIWWRRTASTYFWANCWQKMCLHYLFYAFRKSANIKAITFDFQILIQTNPGWKIHIVRKFVSATTVSKFAFFFSTGTVLDILQPWNLH